MKLLNHSNIRSFDPLTSCRMVFFETKKAKTAESFGEKKLDEMEKIPTKEELEEKAEIEAKAAAEEAKAEAEEAMREANLTEAKPAEKNTKEVNEQSIQDLVGEMGKLPAHERKNYFLSYLNDFPASERAHIIQLFGAALGIEGANLSWKEIVSVLETKFETKKAMSAETEKDRESIG